MGRGGQELVLLQDGLHQHSSGFCLLHPWAAQGVLGQLEQSLSNGLGERGGEVADEQLRGQVSDLSKQERWGGLGQKMDGKAAGTGQEGKPAMWEGHHPPLLSPLRPR